MRYHLSLLAATIIALTTPAHAADPIVGRASVIDGDTIEIHGERIRLNGIDAPESRQWCERADGSEYACGREAAWALDALLGYGPVDCIPKGRDRYGRTIATCMARGRDVGREMVRQGHALAFRRYSMEYVADEEVAVNGGLGMWQGRFVTPWEWRKGAR